MSILCRLGLHEWADDHRSGSYVYEKKVRDLPDNCEEWRTFWKETCVRCGKNRERESFIQSKVRKRYATRTAP